MTDTFKDKDWDKRYRVLGDLAEDKCAEWLDSQNRGYVLYGLNRPPIRMDMLPQRIRHTPDFLTSSTFIECKGFGRDQILKLKIEDFNCMHFWHEIHPLCIFVYDSHNDRTCLTEWQVARDWPADGRVSLGTFPEGKPYFAIPAEVVFDG
jgi:hypothetical protein